MAAASLPSDVIPISCSDDEFSDQQPSDSPAAAAEEDVHIACDVCNTWFLLQETGLTAEEADKLDSFQCSQCQAAGSVCASKTFLIPTMCRRSFGPNGLPVWLLQLPPADPLVDGHDEPRPVLIIERGGANVRTLKEGQLLYQRQLDVASLRNGGVPDDETPWHLCGEPSAFEPNDFKPNQPWKVWRVAAKPLKLQLPPEPDQKKGKAVW